LFGGERGVVRAVKDVSLNICHGETFGLVGESGCGKSTLSRVLLRLIPLDSGEILFEGEAFHKMSDSEVRARRRHMRMIFQKPFSSLNPRQTVKDILSAPFAVHEPGMGKGELKREVLRLMDIVGLSASYIDRYPHEFSGGQRQRIGIARAIALNPKLIICDEPVSALDVSIQAQILNLMKDLQKNFRLTYIFISHNLSVVKHMSDRIAVMYLGEIVELAAADDLYRNALHPYTKALLSAVPDRLAGRGERIILSGDIPSPINPPVGCGFSTRCWKAGRRCSYERPRRVQAKEGHDVACFLFDGGVD
jgi:oligopeptide/dipeptide ABC transporter ATP-binding protein